MQSIWVTQHLVGVTTRSLHALDRRIAPVTVYAVDDAVGSGPLHALGAFGQEAKQPPTTRTTAPRIVPRIDEKGEEFGQKGGHDMTHDRRCYCINT